MTARGGPGSRLRAFRAATGSRPMTPARFWRRIALVVLMTAAVWFAQRGTFERASDAIFGPRTDWHNDYAMSERIYDLVVSRHLTTVPRPCLLLDIHGGDPPEAQTMDVLERPTRACMGNEAAAIKRIPRLFAMRVDRNTGRVETDQGSAGLFHALP